MEVWTLLHRRAYRCRTTLDEACLFVSLHTQRERERLVEEIKELEEGNNYRSQTLQPPQELIDFPQVDDTFTKMLVDDASVTTCPWAREDIWSQSLRAYSCVSLGTQDHKLPRCSQISHPCESVPTAREVHWAKACCWYLLCSRLQGDAHHTITAATTPTFTGGGVVSHCSPPIPAKLADIIWRGEYLDVRASHALKSILHCTTFQIKSARAVPRASIFQMLARCVGN